MKTEIWGGMRVGIIEEEDLVLAFEGPLGLEKMRIQKEALREEIAYLLERYHSQQEFACPDDQSFNGITNAMIFKIMRKLDLVSGGFDVVGRKRKIIRNFLEKSKFNSELAMKVMELAERYIESKGELAVISPLVAARQKLE